MEDKIFNSSFDNVEYGGERLTNAAISIDPAVSGKYEDSTSEDIESLYTERRMWEIMSALYTESEFYEKYKQEPKKIERRDFYRIYYYFKDKLVEYNEFNPVQIFCAIAEFFDMNYKTLYKDVISLEEKAKILEILEETKGLEKHVSPSKKLF